jgi:hypothetical protein
MADRIQALEVAVSSIQNQMAAILAAVSRTPSPESKLPVSTGTPVTPVAGTRIEHGKLVHTTNVLPSDRTGLVQRVGGKDVVEDYFSKKKYYSNDKGSLAPTPRGHSLEVPQAIAEAPVQEYAPILQQETSADTMLIDDVEEIPFGRQEILNMILGINVPPTREEFVVKIERLFSEELAAPGTKLTVNAASKVIERIITNTKEPYLVGILERAAPQFMEYVASIEDLAKSAVSVEESLAQFLAEVSKEDLVSMKTTLSISVAGSAIPKKLGAGILLYTEPDQAQYFIMSGAGVIAAVNTTLSRELLVGDVLVIKASDTHHYSIRYMGHQVDSHDNLIIKFEDGQSMVDDTSIPNMEDYLR